MNTPGLGMVNTRMNTQKRSFGRMTLVAGILGLLFCLAPEAAAQGCAMCYANAEAAGPEAARALNLGILALLSPTLLLFGGIFLLAHRRAKSGTQSDS